MNVMHDGNHGSYSNKSWVNKFMGIFIYVLAEMYTTGKYNTMLHHTTNIQVDEDLDAGRIIRFTKMRNGITFTVSNNITPCFIRPSY
jgi:linoleoyl-CoA desaturase